MKKLSILLFISCSVAFAQPRDTPDDYVPFNFQNITWKSTKNEIRKQFPDAIELEDAISLTTDVASLRAHLFFGFNRDKLSDIGYFFDEEHSNDNLFIEDFLKIKGLLIQKYGEPVRAGKNWKNSLYKNDSENYGMAVSLGHLEYFAKWELPDTDVFIKLTGDNYEIRHIVAYKKYPRDTVVKSNSALNKL